MARQRSWSEISSAKDGAAAVAWRPWRPRVRPQADVLRVRRTPRERLLRRRWRGRDEGHHEYAQGTRFDFSLRGERPDATLHNRARAAMAAVALRYIQPRLAGGCHAVHAGLSAEPDKPVRGHASRDGA